MRYTVVAALVAALPFGRALPPTIAYFTDLSNFETDLIDWAAFGILGDVSAHLTVNASYRFPGRRYFAAHADELLCARSGRRQRSNAAKIIQDGLRLVERGRHRYYPSYGQGDHRADYDDVVAAGKTLLTYQSCMSDGCSTPGCKPGDKCQGGGTWPSYMIDVPAPFNRVMSWINYKYEIQGELYWGVNAADGLYQNSSWEEQLCAGGNGDGSLTYPGRAREIGGTEFVPIASQRLKLIRDGLEDIEYMYVLEDLQGREAALAVVDTVVRAAYDFEHEAAPMIAAREALADAIESALRGERTSS